MFLRRSLTALLLLGTAGPLSAQVAALPPQELHDRLVAVLKSAAPTGWVAGDTMISWYEGPKLVHVINREPDLVSEGMLRGDGMAGTAEVHLRGTIPVTATVRWVRPDSAPRILRFHTEGDSLYLDGTEHAAWPVPMAPWAIADYGMEDLAVPAAMSVAPSSRQAVLLVYRPYAAHWDTVAVTVRRPVADGMFLELRNPDGKREWWLLGAEGALLQIQREGQDFERRTLEMSALMAEYQRLMPLAPR